MEMEPTDTSIVAASGEGRGCLEKLGTKNAAGAGEYYGGKPVAVEYPETIQEIMVTLLDPIGLDIHPFLIGWYNEKVGPKFKLQYPDDALAFVVISGPDMFERCIVPYAKFRLSEDPDFITNDALDDSMRHAFAILQEDLHREGLETDMFHDFDLHPSRRPKVLVQTAAHVAGAVQYLHKSILPQEIQEKQFAKKSDLSGVAIHPKYGGWFAIRGIVVFTNVRLPEGGNELQKPEPVQVFKDPEVIAKVIENFAYAWQTNKWRDMHKGIGVKYSDNFVQFLDLEPSKRWEYVKLCCD